MAAANHASVKARMDMRYARENPGGNAMRRSAETLSTMSAPHPAHPLPFARHVNDRRKLWRKHTLAEQTGARMAIEGAGTALSAIGAAWPAAGVAGVDAILGRLRRALRAAGVDADGLKRLQFTGRQVLVTTSSRSMRFLASGPEQVRAR